MSNKKRHVHFGGMNNDIISILKQSNESLSQQLNSAKTEIDILEQKNEILNDRITSIKNNYNEINADHASLKSAYSSSQSLLTNHNQTKLKNDELLKEIEDMKQIIHTLKTDYRLVTEQNTEYEQKLKKFQVQTTKQQTKLTKLQNDNNCYQQEINKCHHELEENKKCINEQNQEIEFLRDQIKMRKLSRSSSNDSMWSPNKNGFGSGREKSWINITMGSNWSILSGSLATLSKSGSGSGSGSESNVSMDNITFIPHMIAGSSDNSTENSPNMNENYFSPILKETPTGTECESNKSKVRMMHLDGVGMISLLSPRRSK